LARPGSSFVHPFKFVEFPPQVPVLKPKAETFGLVCPGILFHPRPQGKGFSLPGPGFSRTADPALHLLKKDHGNTSLLLGVSALIGAEKIL
jgi:hypothetical protein